MKLTEKQKNCPYCHDQCDLLQTAHTNTVDQIDVYISGNDLRLDSYFSGGDVQKINYCLMYGRPLNEGEE